MKILLTGCAGFIGSHTLEKLLQEGHEVIGVDCFDGFYARSLKEGNLATAHGSERFKLVEGDLADPETYAAIDSAAGQGGFDAVIHLAAKAGVRPSIADPVGYQRANVIATQQLLEYARPRNIIQFVFASSSSVYGVNPDVPWREDQAVLQPISPYASTKVSGELMGHVYSRLFGIRFITVRLFTVYGPRQRPDLAINLFVRQIRAGEPIRMFGDGSTRRDYTYVQDTVQGIVAALHYTNSSYEVINLGNNRTISLREMISSIEEVLGKKAIIEQLPEQPGDVPQTWADISKARQLLNYNPRTSLTEGIRSFVAWQNA